MSPLHNDRVHYRGQEEEGGDEVQERRRRASEKGLSMGGRVKEDQGLKVGKDKEKVHGTIAVDEFETKEKKGQLLHMRWRRDRGR